MEAPLLNFIFSSTLSLLLNMTWQCVAAIRQNYCVELTLPIVCLLTINCWSNINTVLRRNSGGGGGADETLDSKPQQTEISVLLVGLTLDNKCQWRPFSFDIAMCHSRGRSGSEEKAGEWRIGDVFCYTLIAQLQAERVIQRRLLETLDRTSNTAEDSCWLACCNTMTLMSSSQ